MRVTPVAGSLVAGELSGRWPALSGSSLLRCPGTRCPNYLVSSSLMPLQSSDSYADDVVARHQAEIERGERFAFGKNWAAFLTTLDDSRIREAENSLRTHLGVTSLADRTFLDVGSGSGLFSLAARNLGARVTSFDFDPDSVACTRELRRRYWPDDPDWRVESGSALDADYLRSLGTFDVVYSWGVLHHTGHMWDAIHNVIPLVAPGGHLFIAIYNDQGAWSRRWHRIKQLYCSGPVGKAAVCATIIPYWVARGAASQLIRARSPLEPYREYKRLRGMSMTHDWFDWLGGFPFEVATPEQIILPIQRMGFALTNLVTQRGTMGCVEYVFRRTDAPGSN